MLILPRLAQTAGHPVDKVIENQVDMPVRKMSETVVSSLLGRLGTFCGLDKPVKLLTN